MRELALNEKGLRVLSHKPLIQFGAGGRNRTDMTLRSEDFESSASTSFTTPATQTPILCSCTMYSWTDAQRKRQKCRCLYRNPTYSSIKIGRAQQTAARIACLDTTPSLTTTGSAPVMSTTVDPMPSFSGPASSTRSNWSISSALSSPM